MDLAALLATRRQLQLAVDALAQRRVSRAALSLEVLGALIDDVVADVGRECHRQARLDAPACHRCRHPRCGELCEEPGRDIFGLVPDVAQTETFLCDHCRRHVAPGRFAPHLEKCMGLGRTATRAARRTANGTAAQPSAIDAGPAAAAAALSAAAPFANGHYGGAAALSDAQLVASSEPPSPDPSDSDDGDYVDPQLKKRKIGRPLKARPKISPLKKFAVEDLAGGGSSHKPVPLVRGLSETSDTVNVASPGMPFPVQAPPPVVLGQGFASKPAAAIMMAAATHSPLVRQLSNRGLASPSLGVSPAAIFGPGTPSSAQHAGYAQQDARYGHVPYGGGGVLAGGPHKADASGYGAGGHDDDDVGASLHEEDLPELANSQMV